MTRWSAHITDAPEAPGPLWRVTTLILRRSKLWTRRAGWFHRPRGLPVCAAQTGSLCHCSGSFLLIVFISESKWFHFFFPTVVCVSAFVATRGQSKQLIFKPSLFSCLCGFEPSHLPANAKLTLRSLACCLCVSLVISQNGISPMTSCIVRKCRPSCAEKSPDITFRRGDEHVRVDGVQQHIYFWSTWIKHTSCDECSSAVLVQHFVILVFFRPALLPTSMYLFLAN